MSKLSDLVAELEKKQNDASGLKHRTLSSWGKAQRSYLAATEDALPRLLAAAKALETAREALDRDFRCSCQGHAGHCLRCRTLAFVTKALEGKP